MLITLKIKYCDFHYVKNVRGTLIEFKKFIETNKLFKKSVFIFFIFYTITELDLRTH